MPPNIILFTGQSGVRIGAALERLRDGLSSASSDTQIISLEERILSDKLAPNNKQFIDFLSSPQYQQYEIWTETLGNITDELATSPTPNVFLTFHAVYYHQKKRELFSPVNYEALASLRNRVKMIIVLVDDIYDVYRQLMDVGQMYEEYGPVASATDAEKKDAMFASVFNIISLLNWREMEIAISRSIANYLNATLFVVSTRHPTSIFTRLVECPLGDLRLFYLSHPITIIRKEALRAMPGFVGQLENLIKEFLGGDRNVLFCPTSIDELTIKEVNDGYLPVLSPRWKDPYPSEEMLCKPLNPELKEIEPLNPKNYDIARDDTAQQYISSLLSLLWDFIYSKQIVSRDYTLVEQSADGIIICRPHYGGERAGGVMGELEYCCSLMDDQPRRKCIVLSCKNDLNKLLINRLFSSLEETLTRPQPESLRRVRQGWIASNINVLDMSDEDIQDRLESSVLSGDYDFRTGPGDSMWSGDLLEQKRQRKAANMSEVLTNMRQDDILLKISQQVHTAEAEARVSYRKDIIEAEFWGQAVDYIDECIMRGDEQ